MFDYHSFHLSKVLSVHAVRVTYCIIRILIQKITWH